MNSTEFPADNRKNKPQKKEDVKEYMLKTNGQKSFIRFANFQVLLYLAKICDIQQVEEAAKCIQNQKEIPTDLESKFANVMNRK